MQVARKGDSALQKMDRLTCITDVYPTILEWLDLSYSGQTPLHGVSLFSEGENDNRYIVMEDFSNFTAALNPPHDLWALRQKDYFFFSTLEEEALFQIDKNTSGLVPVDNPDEGVMKEIQSKVEQWTKSYPKNRKLHAELKNIEKQYNIRDVYSDGEARPEPGTSLPSKAMRRLSKSFTQNKYKRWS